MFGKYVATSLCVLGLVMVSVSSWAAPVSKQHKSTHKSAKSTKTAAVVKPAAKKAAPKSGSGDMRLAAACSDSGKDGVAACETGEKLSTGLGRWLDGRWRVEASAAAGAFGERPVNRDGDSYYTASIEYEIPIFERFTIGPRLYPMVLYHEYSHPLMYAPALGIAGRVYSNAADRRGFFCELGAASMWQSRYLEKNTSRHNFLLVLGVGYQFKNRLHTTLSVQHMSNAYTASQNNGVNMVGLGLGYTF